MTILAVILTIVCFYVWTRPIIYYGEENNDQDI